MLRHDGQNPLCEGHVLEPVLLRGQGRHDPGHGLGAAVEPLSPAVSNPVPTHVPGLGPGAVARVPLLVEPDEVVRHVLDDLFGLLLGGPAPDPPELGVVEHETHVVLEGLGVLQHGVQVGLELDFPVRVLQGHLPGLSAQGWGGGGEARGDPEVLQGLLQIVLVLLHDGVPHGAKTSVAPHRMKEPWPLVSEIRLELGQEGVKRLDPALHGVGGGLVEVLDDRGRQFLRDLGHESRHLGLHLLQFAPLLLRLFLESLGVLGLQGVHELLVLVDGLFQGHGVDAVLDGRGLFVLGLAQGFLQVRVELPPRNLLLQHGLHEALDGPQGGFQPEVDGGREIVHVAPLEVLGLPVQLGHELLGDNSQERGVAEVPVRVDVGLPELDVPVVAGLLANFTERRVAGVLSVVHGPAPDAPGVGLVHELGPVGEKDAPGVLREEHTPGPGVSPELPGGVCGGRVLPGPDTLIPCGHPQGEACDEVMPVLVGFQPLQDLLERVRSIREQIIPVAFLLALKLKSLSRDLLADLGGFPMLADIHAREVVDPMVLEPRGQGPHEDRPDSPPAQLRGNEQGLHDGLSPLRDDVGDDVGVPQADTNIPSPFLDARRPDFLGSGLGDGELGALLQLFEAAGGIVLVDAVAHRGVDRALVGETLGPTQGLEDLVIAQEGDQGLAQGNDALELRGFPYLEELVLLDQLHKTDLEPIQQMGQILVEHRPGPYRQLPQGVLIRVDVLQE